MFNSGQQVIKFIDLYCENAEHDKDVSLIRFLEFLENIALNSTLKYEVRETAIDYLIRNENDTPLTVYKSIYVRCNSDQMKDYILYNLGYYYGEISEELIIDILKYEKNPNLIVRGMYSLSTNRDPETSKFLVSAFFNDDYSDVFEIKVNEASRRIYKDTQDVT